jgi:hypothetical protein
LHHLRAYHPTFSHPDIQIDDEWIQQLPEDGLFMTNSSTSKLQRLILKRIKTLLRKVIANLLLISAPMGLFLTPTSSHMKWINFEILHEHVLGVIPPILPRHRPLPLELIIIFKI